LSATRYQIFLPWCGQILMSYILGLTYWSRASWSRASVTKIGELFDRFWSFPRKPTRYAAMNYPGHSNLGDEIQTIAALRFLPRVDSWVAREELHQFSSKERHKIILNGWFLHRPERWPPSNSLCPLMISFHLTREIEEGLNVRMLPPSATVLHSRQGLSFLRRNAPIGARDLDTLEQLNSVGVDAYFSGCLTLTLQSSQSALDRRNVYAVDVPNEVYEHLSKGYDGPITRLSHFDRESQPSVRFKRAAALLRNYASAKAVITTRLHCALPCLALNTPVLFIEDAMDSYRFNGLRELLRRASKSEILLDRHDFDLRSPPPNHNKWHVLRDKLTAQCNLFIAQ
jgi:hypothetical protein